MMKKIFFNLLILVSLHISAQDLELSAGLNTTLLNKRYFYKHAGYVSQPGLDLGAQLAFNPAKTLFFGVNLSYYRGGLKYVSKTGIKHLLKRQIWLVKFPIYYKFKADKLALKTGFIFQFPFSDRYIYDIYDGDLQVYHNIDEPLKNPYKDYIQILLGFEYPLSQHLKFNFQISAQKNTHISAGLIYSLNFNTKNNRSSKTVHRM